jgi:rod shape-determining protein MreC
MSLGTIDQSPPPFFRQGTPALSKLLVLGALALLLMVLDARLQWAAPVRQSLAVALSPLQWLALQPLHVARWSGQYLGSLQAAQDEAALARAELMRQAERAAIVEHLAQENRELRDLLGMRTRLPATTRGAQILYQLADPYTLAVVIDRGQSDGVQPGSAVMDGFGVLGQVTRVHWGTAEVRLLTDPRQAMAVINTRTGQRSLAFGMPTDWGAEAQVELRFEPITTQAMVGDVLTTSGIDGVYPAGLPVAQIVQVTVSGADGFAEVQARPLARTQHALHVLVIDPVGRPVANDAPAAAADRAAPSPARGRAP